jgi:peptidoglycan/xylan/chitin deacetylase (PgdA/CDA1 family)
VAKLALKVDVDTCRGTREGVPRLAEMLRNHGAGATFLFSLGPDHTGRAIKRAFRPGFMRKVSRTSVLEHYGLKTLLYGTLLPGPDIGLRCAEILRSVRDQGFEVGIHAWDHVKWQDGVAHAGAAWTAREMRRALRRFEEIFGEPARTHGAAGWQTNIHALRLTQQLGFHYASDTRGSEPFVPVMRAEIVACPQLPTTLPTLDELIGRDDVTPDNVANHLLDLTGTPPAHGHGHVYTLHAELEGGKLAPVFEALLEGWKSQGYDLVSLRELYLGLNMDRLPRNEVSWGSIPGRAGKLAVQGEEFLASRTSGVPGAPQTLDNDCQFPVIRV